MDAASFGASLAVLEPHHRAPTQNTSVRSLSVKPRRDAAALAERKAAAAAAGPAAAVPRAAATWTQADKWAAREALSKMRQRSEFIRNPRTLRGGAAPPTSQELSVDEQFGFTPFFKVLPPKVVFDDYEAGRSYVMKVTLMNISGVGRRLRILQPQTKLFTSSVLRFPPNAGTLAPGMVADCTVRFAPDSNADCEDVLTVVTEAGKFEVPLLGRRPPPELSLPPVLGCGFCLRSDAITSIFSCENSGGAGRFAIVPEGWDAQDGEKATTADVLELAPFRIWPTRFELAHGQSCDINVRFAPEAVGEQTGTFLILCDNLQTIRVTVNGSGCLPQLAVAQFDQLALPDATGTTPSTMTFPTTAPQASRSQRVAFRNSTPLPIPFHWLVAEESAGGGSGLASFTVTPSTGTFPANSSLMFDVIFRPVGSVIYSGTAELVLENIPVAEKAALSVGSDGDASSGDGGGGLCDCAVFRTGLESIGCALEVQVSPTSLTFGVPGQLGEPVTRQLTLRNTSDAPTYFRWGQAVGDGPVVQLDPAEGALPAGGVVHCEAFITPQQSGRFELQLPCSVAHGRALLVPLSGRVAGAGISISTPTVNFGLVSTAHPMERELILTNTSAKELNVRAGWRLDAGGDSASCFRFIPDSGEIDPGESLAVRVILSATKEQRLRTVITCKVDGNEDQCVSARAEVQHPEVYFSTTGLSMGCCYVDVAVDTAIIVRNANHLPASFQWRDFEHEAYDIQIFPASGQLQANETKKLRVMYTARKPVGEVDVLLYCDVPGMARPVGLALTAVATGLSVSTGIHTPATILAAHEMSLLPSTASEVTDTSNAIPLPFGSTGKPIEFGDSVPVFSSAAYVFYITNHTPIPAAFTLHVARNGEPKEIMQLAATLTHPTAGLGRGAGFTMSRVKAEKPAALFKSTVHKGRGLQTTSMSMSSSAQTTGRGATGRGALGASALGATGKSAATKKLLSDDVERTKRLQRQGGAERLGRQVKDQYIAQALGGGSGCVFALSKREGFLEPNGVTMIEVVCHNDAHGSFEDELTLQLQYLTPAARIAPIQFPLRIQTVGQPLTFHPDLLGMSNRPPGAFLQKAERQLRVGGQLSEKAIATKLRSLMVARELDRWAFLSRFRACTARDSRSAEEAMAWQLSFGATARGLPDIQRELVVVNLGARDVQVSWDFFKTRPPSKVLELEHTVAGGDLTGQMPVQLCLTPSLPAPDEGGPFTVEPAMLVVPARSWRPFNLTFSTEPSAVDDWCLVGSSAYADAAAAAEQPQQQLPYMYLGLESASVAPALEFEGSLPAKFGSVAAASGGAAPCSRTLVARNMTSAHLSFDLAVDNKAFALQSVRGFAGESFGGAYSLPPLGTDSIQIQVVFTSTQPRGPDDQTEDGDLVVTFSNGEVKRIALHGDVRFPALTTKPELLLDFGVVTVGHTQTKTLFLANASTVEGAWFLSEEEQEELASAYFGTSGVYAGVIAGKGGGRPHAQAIEVTFCPAGAGKEYRAHIEFRVKCGRGVTVDFVGVGSFDESIVE